MPAAFEGDLGHIERQALEHVAQGFAARDRALEGVEQAGTERIGDLAEDAPRLGTLLEQRRELAAQHRRLRGQLTDQPALLAEQRVAPDQELDQRSALGLEAGGGLGQLQEAGRQVRNPPADIGQPPVEPVPPGAAEGGGDETGVARLRRGAVERYILAKRTQPVAQQLEASGEFSEGFG